METDSADRHARLADDLPDSAAGRPKRLADVHDRLTALSDGHPSSPRYGLDRRSPDAEIKSSRSNPDVAAEGKADGASAAWEGVNEQDSDHPSPADIWLSAERQAHILDGDRRGGGHRHGVGSPGKTEFPADWGDGKVIENVLSVARAPDARPVQQNWNDRWQVQGKRDGVDIVAIVAADGLVWTAWPREGSPGVVKNVPEDK